MAAYFRVYGFGHLPRTGIGSGTLPLPLALTTESHNLKLAYINAFTRSSGESLLCLAGMGRVIDRMIIPVPTNRVKVPH